MKMAEEIMLWNELKEGEWNKPSSTNAISARDSHHHLHYHHQHQHQYHRQRRVLPTTTNLLLLQQPSNETTKEVEEMMPCRIPHSHPQQQSHQHHQNPGLGSEGSASVLGDGDDPLQLLFNRCMSCSSSSSYKEDEAGSITTTTGKGMMMITSSTSVTSMTPTPLQCSFDHSSKTRNEWRDADYDDDNVVITKGSNSQANTNRLQLSSNGAGRRDYEHFFRRKTKRLSYIMRRPAMIMTKLGIWMLTVQILWTLLASNVMFAAASSESTSKGPQHFRRTPDNQTATVGDRVTLACSVENKAGVLQWTRDGFGLGTDRYLEGYDRYSMKISEDEGDFTLEIYPITLEDDAIFQCQVGPGPDGNRELRSANAKVTVEVPTSPPEIIHGDLLQTTEDKEVQLECISRGGKPAAEITWIDGNGHEIKSGVESVKEPLDDGKRFNTRSILRFRPTKEHHNKTFTCQAHNRPAKEVMSTHIRLEVKYAPKVSVKIQSPVIKEFDNVRISCRAEANPPKISYRWFLNDQVLAGDHGSTLALPNVTRKFHDAIIKCEVQNAVGRSQESETLSVIYGPVFRNRPRDVQADLGTSVTLSCDVDGNPPPIIVWIYEPTRAVVYDKANYTTTLTQDTQGKYVCQAHVQGFPTISAEASIHLKGPPTIVSQRVQFGVEGDTVRLECFARSIPLPDKITWTHLGREIDNHDSDYSVLEDSLPNGKRSVLVIRSSQEKDFGAYNCTVTNSYGSHIMEIYLMKQKSGQLVIILTCVIGGVVIIVALTMITLLCQKKSKKPVLMEIDGVEKQTKQSDRSSNDSDLKVEIRTASSLSNIPEHDSEHWDEGSDAMKNESIYRYSDYIDPVFPPKHDGHNNNGYVPYVDYTRDYNPPLTRNSIYNGQAGGMQSPPQYLNNVDPRFSATYGNPYLRTSNTSLPPPHSGSVGGNHSPNSGSHPLAHSVVSPTGNHHNHMNNHHHIPHSHHNNHSNHHTPTSSNHITHNHIVTPTSTVSMNGGIMSGGGGGSGSGSPLIPGSTSPLSHSHQGNTLSNNSTNPYGMRNGAVPQVSRAPSTPSPQYIVPSQPQLKPGTLATHV